MLLCLEIFYIHHSFLNLFCISLSGQENKHNHECWLMIAGLDDSDEDDENQQSSDDGDDDDESEEENEEDEESEEDIKKKSSKKEESFVEEVSVQEESESCLSKEDAIKPEKVPY